MEKRLVKTMIVKDAQFIISAVSEKQYPEGSLPEIAMAGRSNVGKSSFINRMTNRKKLAKTSSKPGRTQTLNYYLINNRFYFVDVPGYGYAAVSKKERRSWGKMIENYLLGRKQLKGVVLLLDIRHEPTGDDCLMYQFLKHCRIPVVVIATKADKISKGKHAKHVKIIREKLQADPEDMVIPFSAETGIGKDEAWKAIKNLLD